MNDQRVKSILKDPFNVETNNEKPESAKNMYWPEFQSSKRIIQCAAKAMLVVSSQSSASCVAFLICVWRAQAGALT